MDYSGTPAVSVFLCHSKLAPVPLAGAACGLRSVAGGALQFQAGAGAEHGKGNWQA